MKDPRGDGKTVTSLTAGRGILPPEFVNFLTRRSYSLLVKGEAATGKTILALSILKELGAAGNYLYLSTRVSPAQLFQNHSWLSEFARMPPKPAPTTEDGAKEETEGEQAETGDAERFVDARLDEPVPFFERMTNELMDVRSPTIVVDSWDPIGRMMDEEALISNTKVLQTWRERAEANMIVLIEDSSDTSFDSLFDGVVALDRYYEEGRVVRMIQLMKLSGVKIKRPSYLFTLDEGIFQTFGTLYPMELESQRRVGWSWEKRVRSTGYQELDAMLDGTLPSGTVLSLNTSSGVNSAMTLLLLGGILGQSASRSKALFFKPFEGIGIEQASGALGEVIPIQQAAPRRASGKAKDWTAALEAQVGKEKRAKRGKKTIMLVGSDFLTGADGGDGREGILEFMKSSMDLTVIVSEGEVSFENAARVSDVSLRLSDINGTPLLQSLLPWTEYFAISAKTGEGPSRINLVPMV